MAHVRQRLNVATCNIPAGRVYLTCFSPLYRTTCFSTVRAPHYLLDGKFCCPAICLTPYTTYRTVNKYSKQVAVELQWLAGYLLFYSLQTVMHHAFTLKVGFHYPSSRAELTARELGCIF